MRQRKTRSGGLAKAIQASGSSVSKLAERLGLTVQAVSQWTRIPTDRCLDVERVTGIPRSELRPDLFGDLQSRKRQPARASSV